MISKPTVPIRWRWIVTLVCLSGTPSVCADDRPQSRVGTNVQLPAFGVAIDARGVLTVKAYPSHALLHAKRLATIRRGIAADASARSKLRKISLVRLEQAIRRKLAAGEKPDDTMRHLAGLHRVQYVFCYPDAADIVVAGPAEGWVEDPSGRAVGISSGRPVILLEDLIAVLRAYPPGSRSDPLIGCSINPNRHGLARLVAFQRTIPDVVSQRGRDLLAARVAQGMHDSLGMAGIEVFGISNKTHFAQVLIEADYRMKRIGTGLEPPPVKMATFFSALRGATHETLQRWWFVPDYKCVRVADDRLGMELVGQGVQLLGEDKMIGDDGTLAISRPKPNKASQMFTQAFTRKFPEIAAASPAYAQLRNMIDLVVTAALFVARTTTGALERRSACWRMKMNCRSKPTTNRAAWPARLTRPGNEIAYSLSRVVAYRYRLARRSPKIGSYWIETARWHRNTAKRARDRRSIDGGGTDSVVDRFSGLRQGCHGFVLRLLESSPGTLGVYRDLLLDRARRTLCCWG